MAFEPHGGLWERLSGLEFHLQDVWMLMPAERGSQLIKADEYSEVDLARPQHLRADPDILLHNQCGMWMTRSTYLVHSFASMMIPKVLPVNTLFSSISLALRLQFVKADLS